MSLKDFARPFKLVFNALQDLALGKKIGNHGDHEENQRSDA
jgi:hypothetical protein